MAIPHYRGLPVRRSILKIRATFAASIAALLGVQVLLSFALGAVPGFFPNTQVPLADVGGIARVDDRIYIASSTTGRVLEYDPSGRLVKWKQMPQRPISLTADEDRLVVRYSGVERIVKTFEPASLWPKSALKVEHTWWGHPWLVLHEEGRVRRLSLQPWYLTALQAPWPAGLCVPPLILSFSLAGKAWDKLKTAAPMEERRDRRPA